MTAVTPDHLSPSACWHQNTKLIQFLCRAVVGQYETQTTDTKQTDSDSIMQSSSTVPEANDPSDTYVLVLS